MFCFAFFPTKYKLGGDEDDDNLVTKFQINNSTQKKKLQNTQFAFFFFLPQKMTFSERKKSHLFFKKTKMIINFNMKGSIYHIV